MNDPWTEDLVDLGLVSYFVSDWAGAKKFYGETLGLPVALAVEEAGWIQYGRPNQAQLAISKWPGPGPMPAGGGVVAIFTCNDVHKTLERFRAKGVRCGEAMEVPGMVIFADFFDPDGNRLQVAQTLQ
jgi:predicted enzyme related to lactoylglutathione lyase